MPQGFRFRTNWRGHLILQVSYEVRHWLDDLSPYNEASICWRDAGAEDLNDFFKPKENT